MDRHPSGVASLPASGRTLAGVSTFVVTSEYGSDPRRMADLRPARYAFFQQLESGGHLLASGQPIGEGMPQGMLILEAADENEASALLDQDPFATTGLITARRIGRWNATIGTRV